jgi:hypothetical protein
MMKDLLYHENHTILTSNQAREKIYIKRCFGIKKIGKNVLDTKNELEKVMAKRKDEAKKKELDKEKLSRRSSLERRLEEQQLKIKLQEECANQSPNTSASSSPDKQESEFLKIYSKVKCATNNDNNNDDNSLQKSSTPMASKS